MTAKTRIKQLEKTHKANDGKPRKIVVMNDAHGDRQAKFDGIEMTQAEADQKAAALPDSVLLLHVKFASDALKDSNA
jgi:CHAT domain-containing protein